MKRNIAVSFLTCLLLIVVAPLPAITANHDLAIDEITMSPQFPSVGESATVTVSVTNRGNLTETGVSFKVVIFGFDVTRTFTIPTLAPHSSQTISFSWTPTQMPANGEVRIRATVEPVPGETEVDNNGMDYANTGGVNFVSDAPWRIEQNSLIPFSFMITDAGTRPLNLDSILIYDVTNGSFIWGNYFNHERIGDEASEQILWVYAVSINSSSFQLQNGVINARCRFKLVGNRQPDDKFLRIYVGSYNLPSLPEWYAGDTHFHTMYSRSGQAGLAQGIQDVEFGAPLFSSYNALSAIGLNWVTISDHSCYLDEPPYQWEYTVHGSATQIVNPGANKWVSMASEISALNSEHPEFRFIQAEEITIEGTTPSQNPLIPNGGKTLHYLYYDEDYIAAGNSGTYVPFIVEEFPASMTLAEALTSTLNNAGFAFAAHPKNRNGLKMVNGTSWEMSDYTPSLANFAFSGLQVWNTRKSTENAANENSPFEYWSSHPTDPFIELDQGVPVWDGLLSDGLTENTIPLQDPPRRIFIEGGSDAHGDFNYQVSYGLVFGFLPQVCANNNAAGKVRTLAYCPPPIGFTDEAVKTALKDGHTILTDGPLVNFGIDVNGDGDLTDAEDMIIGEKSVLTTNQVTNAQLLFMWESTPEFGQIDEIKVYRGTPTTGQTPDPVLTFTPQGGSGQISYDLLTYFPTTTAEYRYLRVETRSHVGQENYRCYTNPIWLTVQEIQTVSGDVSGTWPAGTTYHVIGEINIPANQTLTIEPGVQVIFQGPYSFTINGTLNAIGLQADSIIFTPQNITEGWRGLIFAGLSASQLSYAIIDHVNTNVGNLGGGGIFCNHSNPLISNCTIKNNSVSGIGGSHADGGGIHCYYSNSTIINCDIFQNQAEDGGGICCWVSDPTIENCRIFENSASASGGGIYCGYSNAIVSNCILNNNTATQSYGGGGIFSSQSSAVIKNCIVWANSLPAIRVYTGSISINYSDVQQGWPGTGNIGDDPQFIQGYHLSQDPCQPGVSNPCVNGGDPSSPMITGTTRTDGVQDAGIVDMGYHYPVGTSQIASAAIPEEELINPSTFTLHSSSPNPFNPSTTIRYDLPEAVKVTLNVYDVQGRLVASLVNGMREAGKHEVTFDGSLLSSGIYLYRINAGSWSAVGKMALVK
jgi:hypothetical protein